jgi:uncharacterized SAM-binding protein YcdF (DUF218 family)
MKSLILPWMRPTALIWLAWTVWLAWMLARRRIPVTRLMVPLAAWSLFSLLTCTPFSSWLLRGLEDKHPPVTLEAAPKVDAIVCLGGSSEPNAREPAGFHLNVAADRVSAAISLWAAGVAPVIVLGGGGPPEEGAPGEADTVIARLIAVGVPASALINLGVCTDTRHEAMKTRALAAARGWKKIGLVTSASHMPRTHATFVAAGLDPVALPCNYLSSFNRPGAMHYIHKPGTAGLVLFETWLHETLGWIAYKAKGWL